jgi:hypothetical protein
VADNQLKDFLDADGSIITNPASPGPLDTYQLRVGVLATDVQHGLRGGGTQHAAVTDLANGFMTPAQKAALEAATAAAASLDGRLDTAESTITSLDGRLDTAESAITSLDGRLDTAEADIIALDGRIDALETTTQFLCFDPDAPAASPHAHDDDATSGSFAGAWVVWDPSAMVSASAAGGRYVLTATGNGGSRWTGRYRAVPAAEYQISVRVGLEAPTSGVQSAGLLLFDDVLAAPTTSDFRALHLQTSAGARTIETNTWSAHDGGPSAATSVSGVAPWLRYRVNGTSVSSDFSFDGVSWWNAVTVTLAFTPLYYGFGLRVVTNTQAARANFQHFRVLSGGGTSDFLGGTRGRNVTRQV